MPYTEAQKNATIKYLKEKTDDIRLRTPRGTKDRWKAAADASGQSMTAYVVETVERRIRSEENNIPPIDMDNMPE